MDKKEKLIPRKIWLFWQQGISEAPFIVRKCIDSWIKENPTWDVIILDSENLNNYVTLDLPEDIVSNLLVAHQSDLVRLRVLSEHGGVWADAATFCSKPLDEWIDNYSKSGFFAFHQPGRDRILSNWFIASEKGCPISMKLYMLLKLYWVENDFSRPNTLQRITNRILSKTLNLSDKTTKYWFNPIVTRLLKVYPYFVFHYMFEKLISTDSESKAIWQSMKKLSAVPPHIIQKLGLFSLPTDSIKKTINSNEIPLYKLTWKADYSRYSSDTLLYYLLENR